MDKQKDSGRSEQFAGDEEIKSDPGLDPDWQQRKGMMSAEEVARLAAQQGKPVTGAIRADESSNYGPAAKETFYRQPDKEGPPERELDDKEAAEQGHVLPQTPADEWQKYDWA